MLVSPFRVIGIGYRFSPIGRNQEEISINIADNSNLLRYQELFKGRWGIIKWGLLFTGLKPYSVANQSA